MLYNIIHNESCIDTMKNFDDKCIDLVLTSPPYNMRTRIRNGEYTTREKSEHFSKKYLFFDDALPIDEFYSFHKSVLLELLRCSKIVLYNFQIVTGSKEAFFRLIGDLSKHIKDIIIWDKKNGQPAMHENVLNSSYEMILILEDDGMAGRMIRNAKFKRGEMQNIIRVSSKNIFKFDDTHKASFPKELAKVLIKNFSNENDIIYDPFMGCGTTASACVELNRKYIGSEIVSEYIPIIQKNLFHSQPALMGG